MLNLKILIVDDELSSLKLIESILKRKFLKIYSANSGERALEIFKESKVDIVLTDIHMPNMDGLELSKKLKELDENLQIIVLTAFDDRETLVKAIEVGVDYFLFKPFELKSFDTILKKVTSKVQKQIKAQTITKKFLSAIDQSSNAILMINEDSKIEYINSTFTEMFNIEKSDLINRDFKSLKNIEPKLYMDIFVRFSAKISSIGEVKIGDKFFKVKISPIVTNSNILGYAVVVADITEKKFIQEQLKEKDRLLMVQSREAVAGEIISTIAHHWRQPISIVSTIINKILIDVNLKTLNEDNLIESLKSANLNLLKLSNTIDTFKESFESSKERELIELNKLIDKSIDIISPTLKESKIEIVTKYRYKDEISTYKSELIQVIINILINAKDIFKEREVEKPTIKIYTYKIKDSLVISILDNAKGVEKAILEKIFEPYFSTKKSLNSTGLGLYISKTIVQKRLNGELKVKNRKDGALFSIVIKAKV